MTTGWHKVRWLVAVLALALAAAGCGDDDDGDGDEGASDTTEASDADDGGDGGDAGDGDACALLERITDLDSQSEGILNDTLGPALAGGDPEAAQAAFDEFLEQFRPFAEEQLPDLVDAYDGLAEAVPSELRADVEELRDFTAETLEGLAEAESVEDVEALFTADPERATGAGQATLRIDEFSRDECDIVLAN
jgi:hypothetical protein